MTELNNQDLVPMNKLQGLITHLFASNMRRKFKIIMRTKEF